MFITYCEDAGSSNRGVESQGSGRGAWQATKACLPRDFSTTVVLRDYHHQYQPPRRLSTVKSPNEQAETWGYAIVVSSHLGQGHASVPQAWLLVCRFRARMCPQRQRHHTIALDRWVSEVVLCQCTPRGEGFSSSSLQRSKFSGVRRRTSLLFLRLIRLEVFLEPPQECRRPRRLHIDMTQTRLRLVSDRNIERRNAVVSRVDVPGDPRSVRKAISQRLRESS